MIYLCGPSCLFRSIRDVQIWLKSVTLVEFIDITIAAELQTCISKVCKDELKRIQKSPYVGLMLDESLDIAVQKKLVLFFKILVEESPKLNLLPMLKRRMGKQRPSMLQF